MLFAVACNSLLWFFLFLGCLLYLLFHLSLHQFEPPSFFPWWVWLEVYELCLSSERTTSSFTEFFLSFSSFLFHLFLSWSFRFLPFCYSEFCLFFLWSFQYNVGFSQVCDLPSFLRWDCVTVAFPLRTASGASYRFWMTVLSFSFVSKYCLIFCFISSVIH